MKSKILLLFISLLFISNASASTSWWNTSWQYRIDNYIDDGYRPIQLNMSINSSVGTNNATTVYCNYQCNVNFTDVRFLLDNSTILPYYYDYNKKKFYINITGNGTINMYFGNPTAVANSTFGGTFPFNETFSGDLSNYYEYDVGNYIGITNGRLSLNGTGIWNGNGIVSKRNFTRPFILEFEQYMKNNSMYMHSGYARNPPITIQGSYISNNLGTYYRSINDSQTNLLVSASTDASNLDLITYVYDELSSVNIYINGIYKNSYTSYNNNENFMAQIHSGQGFIDNIRILNYTSFGYPQFNTWTNGHIAIQSLTPVNGSTGISSSAVTLTWKEWEVDTPHTLYISKDNEYLNIVSASTISSHIYENFTTTIYGLTNNTKYWWKVKNNSGYYTLSMNFTTSATPTTDGRLNLTAFDETNYSFRINNFTADIYDTNGTKITRNSTNGWCNLSSSEINSGIYLVKISNSSYKERSVLFTSPDNVTMYLPNTSNNIDLAVFVLNDYTGQFPWSSTILKVYNNNSLMYSSYFSADAKIPVYLIDASTYSIHIENGDNTRIWGNYVPYTSQEVGILVSTVDTDTKDFSYNISNSITGITLSWSGVSNIRYVNYTIYKGDSRSVEYTLNTSLDTGETNYIKSGSTDIYYVVFNTSTIHSGFFATKKIFEDRTVKERYPGTIFSGNSSAWKYGTFILPDSWAYAAATGLLILLAVSFNVYFGWFGALITVIFANMFYYWKWLPQLTYTNVDGSSGLDYGQGLLILLFIISVWLMRKDSGD